MRWIEIISLRCPASLNMRFVDELLKELGKPDPPEHLEGIRIYRHSIVETDLSIHIHWKSESGNQSKSPLGLRVSSALKDLGLLNHSVWVETTAKEFPHSDAGPGPPGHPGA